MCHLLLAIVCTLGLSALSGLSGCANATPKPPLATGDPVQPLPACIDLRRRGGTC